MRGMMLVAVLYAALTAHRVTVWHDNVSLWADAAVIAPLSPRVHFNLMEAYKATGNVAAAETEWQRLLESAMLQ